jgi:tetratricopeptide (TPR) repeat protein
MQHPAVPVPLRKLLPALLAIAGLLAVSASPAGGLPRKPDSWIELRAPHFTILSDAGERRAREVAADLERLRSAIAEINPKIGLNSPVPTSIYVFSGPSSFKEYRPLYDGKPKDVAGYFTSRPHGNYVTIDADPRMDSTRVVHHEYVHYLLDHNFPGLPLWLNEGLAELYSSFETSGAEAKLGLPIAEHVFWLRENPLIPLKDLEAMTTDSRDYNEGSRRGVFYAQSWALVHWLLVGGPEQRGQLVSYLQDLDQGIPGEAAFRRAFGDPAELERQLRTYVRQRRFKYLSLPLAEGAERAGGDLRPLARADALSRLGELLLNSGSEGEGAGKRLAAAEEHFRAALAADPAHGRATAGLGAVARQAGRLDQAAAHFEQAARLAPDDFFVQFLYGSALLETEAGAARLPRARAALRRSVELRPDFAEGWGQLAYSYTFGDEGELAEEAVEPFERAWRLRPSRPELAFNLALVYMRTGQRARAEEMVEKGLASLGKPLLVEQARQALLVAEWREIEENLVRQGRFEEAVAPLEAIVGKITGAEQRATFENRLAEIRAAVEMNRFVDGYNRAVELANAGQAAEAAALLEDLAATAPDPGQADQARELLERVRERL